jgi:lipopolysaccharide export system permease protein
VRQNLDRYVSGAVLGSMLASLVFFLFLTILLDLLNNLGGYLDKADNLGMSTMQLFGFLGGYYLRLVPFSFVTIAPFATVIGCMFAIARLMTQNELQPMLFVGRSMMRVLRPALFAGVVMALLMGACWQWVVPSISADVTQVQSVLSGGERTIRNLVIEVRGETFLGLQVQRYEPESRRMHAVHLLRRGTQPGDAVLILADAAQWDDAVGDWRLENGVHRTADDDAPCELLGAPEWTPALVLQRGQADVPCELLSYDELLETRVQRPNRKDVQMALHRHVTYPLANLILLLLALPFAIHFERGSRIERVLSAIGVCAGYLLFDLTCQNLGFNGHIHPVVAAWSPTILFGSLGVVLFGSVRT